MHTTTSQFNLLEEKWIPVLYSNGTFDRVGISTALQSADIIRCIAVGNPMDRLVILRFLLAVLYWCKGNPPDDMDISSRENFSADSFSKLFDNADHFNLFGQGKRFYQYQKSDDKLLTANYISVGHNLSIPGPAFQGRTVAP